MNLIANIVKTLWIPANCLCQTGLSHHDYITELTWLLLLKIAPSFIQNLPSTLNWQTLLHKKGVKQYDYYQTILHKLARHHNPYFAGIFAKAETRLQTSEQLAQLLTALTAIDQVELDDLGEIYESLLELCARHDNSVLNPPRALVDMMIIAMHPQPGEFIQDPCARTANFLVAAQQYIEVMNEDLFELSPLQQDFQQQQAFSGTESELQQQRLALMNCLLHKVDTPNHVAVQLSESVNLAHLSHADVVFSNLVFPTELDRSLTLLQKIYKNLKLGARAALIVPDRVLQDSGFAQQVRSELLNECVLHTILRLPYGTFYPHNNCAQVLFLYKSTRSCESTQTIWFYDLRSHMPHFNKDLWLSRQHLVPFENVYGDDPLGQTVRVDEGEIGYWRAFSREFLAEHQDKLEIRWLEEDEVVESDTDNFWEILKETVGELEELTLLLCEEPKLSK